MKLRQRIRKGFLLISFFLFPLTIYYFSPYLPVQAAVSGIIAGSLFVFSFMFLVSLFAGRIICAYLCPAGALQDICSVINNKTVKKGRWLKYMIWIPWLSLIAFFIISAGGISEFNFWYMTTNGLSVAEPKDFIIYYGVGSIITILAFSVGRRSSCHLICWMAPFMLIGKKFSETAKFPRLQILANASKCTSCLKCSSNCPMSLEVHDMVKNSAIRHADCILCGECIDNCPESVLYYTVKSGN